MTFERNEINKNSQGGTERMMEGLYSRIDPELISKFQIIPSRVRELKNDKIRIYWLHDLPNDPETNHLKNQSSRDRFHKIVYCGNWQMSQYQSQLNIPHDQKTCMLETATTPMLWQPKSKEEIRLIYTSTPQRGLQLLIPVFEELCKTHDNIVLDVFSSFKIYGWDEYDKQFESLYDICRNHPKINYHGFAPNEVVREALQKSHILAYPSIWLECNSTSVIEAMSAGVMCVHPNYGGLADTSGNLNMMYNWDKNSNIHANIFYSVMDQAIRSVNDNQVQNYLKFVKEYADNRFNWDKIAAQWTSLLIYLAEEYKDADLSVPTESLFTYQT
jgi:glycosyltransferase involved in cell wall biosynthesis